MAKARPHPTKAELAILRVLWTEGPLSVRAVQNILNSRKRPATPRPQDHADHGRQRPGRARRHGRPQIYRPRYSEDRTQKQLLTDLIQRVYGGSVKALVMHAIGTRKPSDEDLDAIEKLLDRFEGDKK